jgi:hypothetical protein
VKFKEYVNYIRERYGVDLSYVKINVSHLRIGFPGTYWYEKGEITVNNGLLILTPIIIFAFALIIPRVAVPLLIGGSIILLLCILAILSTESGIMHELMHGVIYNKAKEKTFEIDDYIKEGFCEWEAINADVVSKYSRIASRILLIFFIPLYIVKDERLRISYQYLFEQLNSLYSNLNFDHFNLKRIEEKEKRLALCDNDKAILYDLIKEEILRINRKELCKGLIIPEKIDRLKKVKVSFLKAFSYYVRNLFTFHR